MSEGIAHVPAGPDGGARDTCLNGVAGPTGACRHARSQHPARSVGATAHDVQHDVPHGAFHFDGRMLHGLPLIAVKAPLFALGAADLGIAR